MAPKICIIGSGPGGSVVAKRLVETSCCEVTLIDIDSIGEPLRDFCLESVSIGQAFNVAPTRAFGFGGTSNLWHGVLTEIDPEDLALLDNFASASISNELKKYYRSLFDLFPGIEDFSFDPPKSNDIDSYFIREILGNRNFIGKVFAIQNKPLRTKDIIRSLLRFKNFRIIENAVVLTLKEGLNKGTIESVQYTKDGCNNILTADYFILAAGALETPRIILQSIKESSISLDNSNIGKYLVDHPWAVIGEVRSRSKEKIRLYNDSRKLKALKPRIGLRLSQSVPRGIEGYSWSNHCVSFKPLILSQYADFKEALKDIISTRSIHSAIRLIRKHRVSEILASLIMLALEKFSNGVDVDRALVFLYLEQEPTENSSVTLSEKIDNYGRFIPLIHWHLSDTCKSVPDKIYGEIEHALSRTKEFELIKSLSNEIVFSSGSHHAGTMRMHFDERFGVIDSDLMVHGLNNSYVCDLSIFPNFGNSNPTFTLCAFAARLADHIKMLVSNSTHPAEISQQ